MYQNQLIINISFKIDVVICITDVIDQICEISHDSKHSMVWFCADIV